MTEYYFKYDSKAFENVPGTHRKLNRYKPEVWKYSKMRFKPHGRFSAQILSSVLVSLCSQGDEYLFYD